MNIQKLKDELYLVNDDLLRLFIRHLELTGQIADERVKEGKLSHDRKLGEELLERVVGQTPQDVQSYALEFLHNVINIEKELHKGKK